MKRTPATIFAILIAVVFAINLWSQDTGGSQPLPSDSPGGSSDIQTPVTSVPLPSSFGKESLGSSLEQVKTDLKSDPLFAYRGDPDLSLSPSSNQPIIRTAGAGYLISGVFQFYEDKLYTITLQLNTTRMDYFTMYNTLSAKYGEPDYLDPESCYWERNGVRLVLEKPLNVKYISMDVFNRIREEGAAQQSVAEYSRELFLDNF